MGKGWRKKMGIAGPKKKPVMMPESYYNQIMPSMAAKTLIAMNQIKRGRL